jgi:SAM-dependent methyltransferase
MREKPIVCAACESPDPEIVMVGGLRRTSCRSCHHSQRIDVEAFDYAGFAMGGTGLAPARLAAQAEFIATRLGDGARALEIGCAAGDLAQELRRRKAFAAYDGVELSPARDLAAKRLDHVFATPLEDLLTSGDIAAASYDIVLASHCLEHLDDPSAMIAAMRRAMNPEGLLFVETPNRSGHARLPFDDNRSHLHFFGASSLTRLLARHGLEAIAVETGARLDARYSDCLRVLARRHTLPAAGAALPAAGAALPAAGAALPAAGAALPAAGAAPPAADAALLSSHPALAGVDKLVVWGAGRMVDEMLSPYFDPARIAFFVDTDVRKQGSLRLGARVRDPAALEKGSGWIVLINSLESEAAIRAEIEAHHRATVASVIGIAELLD